MNLDAEVKILDMSLGQEIDGQLATPQTLLNYINGFINKEAMLSSDSKAALEISSKSKAKHLVRSSKPTDTFQEMDARSTAILSIDDIVKNAVLIESHSNYKVNKTDVENVHRLYVPMRIGEKTFLLRLVAHETKDKSGLKPIKADLFDLIIENKINSTSQSGLLSGSTLSSAPPATLGGTTINIREMLLGVKDAYGNEYFDANGIPTNPTAWQTERFGEQYNQEQARETREARGNISFSDAGAIISLFKNADKSTILHELGHYFLEDMRRMAMLEGVNNKQVKADFAALTEWLGVSDIDMSQGFDALNETDRKRWKNAQEKFAAGFEKYLFEGKAPNSGLMKAFETFKKWMTGIYKVIKRITYTDADGKQVAFEINDEVRGIMDRIIATESDAAISMSDEAYTELREEFTRQGMTDEAISAHDEAALEARAKAKAELLKIMMNEMSEEERARMEEFRAEVEKVAREQIMEEDKYKIYNALTDTEGAFRISDGDLDVLIAEYEKSGETIESQPFGNMTVGQTMDLFGNFESVKEFVEMLRDARDNPVEQEVAAAVELAVATEYLGNNAEQLKNEADKAAHNDVSLNRIAMELAILNERLDQERASDVESTDGAQDMSPLNDLSKVDNTESMAHEKQLAVDIEEFGNAVDAYVNNPKGWNKSKPVPVLSKTPPVFKLLGAEEHPITMNAKHFGNVIDTKEKEALPKKKRDKLHPLPADIIKQIPQALMRPVMVLKDSSTRESEKKDRTFIVMLEVRHEGKSIVVPFTINKESGRKHYNIIDSVFDKDGRDIKELGKSVPFEEYFLIESEKNLLYIDKEKAREWARIADEENKKNRSEAQSASITKITKIESLPSKLEALLQNDSFMESISTEADLDKLYQEEKAREWARVADEENKKNRSEAQSASLTKITKIESLLAKLEALLQNDSFMESISTEADLDKLHQEDKNNPIQQSASGNNPILSESSPFIDKENGVPHDESRYQPGRDGQKSPLIDSKLQQFFDSVKKAPDLEGKKPDAGTSSQSRPERGGSDFKDGAPTAADKAEKNVAPKGKRKLSREQAQQEMLEIKIAEAFAQKAINNKPVGKAVSIKTFLLAERRAAKSALRALSERRYKDAVKYKRRELVAHAMAKAAIDASREVNAANKLFASLKKRRKKMTFEMEGAWNQIAAILKKFGFKDWRDMELNADRPRLFDWLHNHDLTAFDEMGERVPIIPDFVMDSPGAVNVKDLKLSEFRDIRDAVKMILQAARNANELLSDEKRRNFAEAVAALEDSIISNVSEFKELPPEKQQQRKEFFQTVKKFGKELTRAEVIARMLDRLVECVKRDVDDPLGSSNDLVSGKITTVLNSDFNDEGAVYFVQTLPLPLEILGFERNIDIAL